MSRQSRLCVDLISLTVVSVNAGMIRSFNPVSRVYVDYCPIIGK